MELTRDKAFEIAMTSKQNVDSVMALIEKEILENANKGRFDIQYEVQAVMVDIVIERLERNGYNTRRLHPVGAFEIEWGNSPL